MRIDLHAHTTASDGLLKPRELVDLALEIGLDAIAVTDHDTVGGVAEAKEAAAESGKLEVVSGIEVSSYIEDRSMHMLGYFVDHESSLLHEFAQERSAARRARIKASVERLQEADVDISYEEVAAQAPGGGSPGRPHIGRVLMEKGYAESVHEAFRKWLLEGQPGYVAYPKPEAEEAVELIEAAGGIPVIAHAALDKLDPHLELLVEKGLKGIEVYHSEHEETDHERYLAFARKHDLLITGGSDFHRVNGAEGGILGGTDVPPECLEQLRAYHAEHSG